MGVEISHMHCMNQERKRPRMGKARSASDHVTPSIIPYAFVCVYLLVLQ